MGQTRLVDQTRTHPMMVNSGGMRKKIEFGGGVQSKRSVQWLLQLAYQPKPRKVYYIVYRVYIIDYIILSKSYCLYDDLDEFHLRWLTMNGFDATFPISIILCFNHPNWNLDWVSTWCSLIVKVKFRTSKMRITLKWAEKFISIEPHVLNLFTTYINMWSFEVKYSTLKSQYLKRLHLHLNQMIFYLIQIVANF